jgi:hypothetical protein
MPRGGQGRQGIDQFKAGNGKLNYVKQAGTGRLKQLFQSHKPIFPNFLLDISRFTNYKLRQS